MIARAWVGPSLAALLLLGCEASKPASTTQSATGSAAPSSAAPHSSTQASAQHEPRPLPPQKEYAKTAKSTLGTLPEGIGVAVGGVAPNPTVLDMAGRKTELGKAYASGPVLLVFYRGGWCPYCNFQIKKLTDNIKQLEKREIKVIALSVDQPRQTKELQRTYSIPFGLVSDPDLEAHKAFKVVQKVNDTQVAGMKGRGIDLESYSGRKHHSVAVPALFLIGTDGKVHWAHAATDHKTRPKLEDLLAALDEVEIIEKIKAKNDEYRSKKK